MDIEKVELRSEKVRHVMGQTPPVLVRTGTMIVTVLFAIICYATYKIPYPFTIEADGIVISSDSIHNNLIIELFIPYRYNNYYQVVKRQVSTTYEGRESVVIECDIDSVSDNVVILNGENFFHAYTYISNDDIKKYRLKENMKVHSTTIINNKTILQQIIRK